MISQRATEVVTSFSLVERQVGSSNKGFECLYMEKVALKVVRETVPAKSSKPNEGVPVESAKAIARG